MSFLQTRPPQLVMLQGELDASTHASLQALLFDHLPPPGGDLILDLTHVTGLDSAGLRLLVTCLRRVAGAGGLLAIAGLQPGPATLLRLLGATDLWELHPDSHAAALAIADRRNHGPD